MVKFEGKEYPIPEMFCSACKNKFITPDTKYLKENIHLGICPICSSERISAMEVICGRVFDPLSKIGGKLYVKN